MITTKLIFDRRGTASRTKEGYIEVRMIHQRKAVYISTGVRVYKNEWAAGRIVNRQDADVLNHRLALIYEKVCAEINRCMENDMPLDVDAIKVLALNNIDGGSERQTFMDWLGKQIDMLPLADGTIKHYKTLQLRLEEFGKIQRWADVTSENIYEFDSWLHKLRANDGNRISDAAVYNYHKCFKAMLNKAVAFDKIMRNPYSRLKFNRGESESIEFLTEEEMEAIETLQVPEGSRLERVRDLFVFQMYTGLAYSDAQAFDFSQYKKVDGKWINSRERIKSGVPYISSLLPPVVKVLEKYGYEVPKIDNADYNILLKIIGTMAGISTKMHTHLARHTFATYMLRQGVKIENLQRMLGHKNIRQTMRYAKVLAESVHDDFEKVAAKLKK